MLPKILISCPTSIRKEYVLSQYFENIRSLSYPEKYFYFCDNSHDPIFHVKEILLKGFECGYVSPHGKPNNVYICESYNLIRDYFLKGDYDYLLTLEADEFPQKDILEEMLMYDYPVVAARYFWGEGENSRLLGFEMDDSFGDNINRIIGLQEGFSEYGTGKTKSFNPALGCCLIKRDVVEEIEFRVADHNIHNDSYFHLDRYFSGIDCKIIDIIVEHRNQGWSGITDAKTIWT